MTSRSGFQGELPVIQGIFTHLQWGDSKAGISTLPNLELVLLFALVLHISIPHRRIDKNTNVLWYFCPLVNLRVDLFLVVSSLRRLHFITIDTDDFPIPLEYHTHIHTHHNGNILHPGSSRSRAAGSIHDNSQRRPVSIPYHQKQANLSPHRPPRRRSHVLCAHALGSHKTRYG